MSEINENDAPLGYIAVNQCVTYLMVMVVAMVVILIEMLAFTCARRITGQTTKM